MTKHKKRSGWLLITSSTVCIMALLVLWAGLTPTLRGQEEASPAEEHVAIAARYQQEAAETREAIKRHQIAIDVYQRGTEQPYTVMNPQGRKQMIQHCERVITYYTDAAKELDAMAAEHAAVAKQLTGSGRAEEQ